MTGQGRSHGWAWEDIGPITCEPGSANQTGFKPPQKGCITDKNTPPFHQLSGWLDSDNPAGEEARCGGPGLVSLHMVCGCEARWTYSEILSNDVRGGL
jgi:hypothetical protein